MACRDFQEVIGTTTTETSYLLEIRGLVELYAGVRFLVFAWGRLLASEETRSHRLKDKLNYGFSIRCIKDSE